MFKNIKTQKYLAVFLAAATVPQAILGAPGYILGKTFEYTTKIIGEVSQYLYTGGKITRSIGLDAVTREIWKRFPLGLPVSLLTIKEGGTNKTKQVFIMGAVLGNCKTGNYILGFGTFYKGSGVLTAGYCAAGP